MSGKYSREILRNSYSNGCDKHVFTSLPIITSERKNEYCEIHNFKKEGMGVIQYYNDEGVVNYSLFCKWTQGNINGKAYLFKMSDNCFTSILTFLKNELVDEVPFSSVELDTGIIDEFDGSRWEGRILNGLAFGRGVQFNDRDEIIFSGFCINGKRAGLGTSFYGLPSPSPIPHKTACWYHDLSYGPTTVFDRHGDVDGTPITVAGKIIGESITCYENQELVFYPFLTSIVIGDNCGKNEIDLFDISCCPHLTSLVIGNNCFPHSSGFSLCNLPKLQRLQIGVDCFTFCNRDTHTPWEISNRKAIKKCHSLFEIRHCPLLEVIECGEGSFSSYSECVLGDLPSCTYLRFGVVVEGDADYQRGSWCFYWCQSLKLAKLEQLKEVTIGNYGFYFCNHFSIECML